jgi:glucose-6-phosphate dehydrogenase assembly protein OpcA
MTTLVIVIVAIVIVAVVVGAMQMQRRRSARLQDRFGPEYERVVADTGNRRQGESELAIREERREQLDIRPLDADARDRYSAAWQEVQARFVDSPNDAVGEADRLVHQVMRDRGYPMDDFDQRAADVSVDHAGVVADYRAAHDISERNDVGEATTEDLRRAMVHYRALFEDLLVVDTSPTTLKEARHG